MADDAWLAAGPLRIPRGELQYQASRSGGPGGQHVNTSSTRIELWWQPRTSTALTDAQRALLEERLAGRLDQDGWIRLVESGSRSQLRNRETVTERFLELIEKAVRPKKVRRKTRISPAQKAARLTAKRQHSARKRLRGRVRGEDE